MNETTPQQTGSTEDGSSGGGAAAAASSAAPGSSSRRSSKAGGLTAGVSNIFSGLSREVGNLMGKGETLLGGNPIADAIDKATSEQLIGADWGANMEICDMINSSSTGNARQPGEGPQKAAKALRKRLRSDNPKVLQLTLVLCEACVKNCGRELHLLFASKDFLKDVTAPADGSKGWEVRTEVIRLIQQWGRAFEHDPEMHSFVDVYNSMKRMGYPFPETQEGEVPVFSPPAQQAQAAGGRGAGAAGQQVASRSAGSRGSQPARVARTPEEEAEKLEVDIQAVRDKVELCQQMLPQSIGISKDPVLYEVVGFLEACRPRMVDIIEAGMSGHPYVGAEVLEACLKVNDALLRTLEAEKNGMSIEVEVIHLDFGPEKPRAPAAAAAAGGGRRGVENFDIMTGKLSNVQLEEDEDAGSSSFTIMGEYEDDDEEGLVRRPPPPAAGPTTIKAEKAEEEDPFSEFDELVNASSTAASAASFSETGTKAREDNPFANGGGEEGMSGKPTSGGDDLEDFDAFLAGVEKTTSSSS